MMTFEDELLQRFWRALRKRTGHSAPAGVVHAAEDATLWDRFLERTPAAIGEAQGRRAAAEELRDEILSFEPAERLGHLANPRFHSEDLLELLLDESQELQAADAEAAAFWARLAGQLAEALRDKRFLGSDAQVRAGVLHGNALRLAGDREGAERTFAAANAHLDEDSPELPLYARALGVLRWEQHRLAEAVSLFEHAARRFLGEDLDLDAGLSLLLAGVLHGETCMPDRGLNFLLLGWRKAVPTPQPWLSLRGGFLLASRLVEAAELAIARTVLAETMELYKQIRDEHETLCGFRLEGAARARLGEIGQAEDLLQGVRQTRLNRRHLPELVLTSLELAIVLAELGRDSEIAQLAADVEGFEPEEGGVFAVEAFQLFQTFRSQGYNLLRSAAGAAAEFRRLCRLFAVPLDPIPFV
ncbi:MAG TPA: hypothetical protein VEW48_06810 [Thermoanaerobaculia bacterium]|nr:hypothetical protein [Thermoanaerobaculia bacterium]